MKLTNLSYYNIPEVSQHVNRLQQLLPFYYSQKKAQQALLICLSNQVGVVYGIEDDKQLVGYISVEQQASQVNVTSFLILKGQLTSKKGYRFWLNFLEKITKLTNGDDITIQLPIMDQRLFAALKSLGYQMTTEDTQCFSFSKRMTYRTALVLAGGGARGAYQIGVWQALAELNVSFDLITGTSVGALNGSLIIQGDRAVAQKMWREIDTGKILSYEGLPLDNRFTMQETMLNIQKLVFSAMNHQGVSTAPLATLIHDLLDEDKMYQQPKDLYLCTTQLPQLKERVISLKDTSPGEFSKWLLASASFYPAMAATEIAGAYYVDGGYRNNIPIDVAIKAGATEAIVVDVKGPGVTKSTTIPDDMPVRQLTSSWTLGPVLLFNGARSDFNMRLGYLETLKSYGRYFGHWYTFDHQLTDQEVVAWQKVFNEKVLSKEDLAAVKK